MNMTRKKIGVVKRRFFNIVPEPETAQVQFFLNMNGALPVPAFVQNIVIAFHQVNMQIGKIVPPPLKQFQFFVLMTVKKVAHHNQLPGLKILDLVYQALEVFFVHGLWYRNTRFAKMTRFTKMQVRHQQRFFFFPKNTSVSRQPKLLL
jgi:hypothetical protein